MLHIDNDDLNNSIVTRYSPNVNHGSPNHKRPSQYLRITSNLHHSQTRLPAHKARTRLALSSNSYFTSINLLRRQKLTTQHQSHNNHSSNLIKNLLKYHLKFEHKKLAQRMHIKNVSSLLSLNRRILTRNQPNRNHRRTNLKRPRANLRINSNDLNLQARMTNQFSARYLLNRLSSTTMIALKRSQGIVNTRLNPQNYNIIGHQSQQHAHQATANHARQLVTRTKLNDSKQSVHNILHYSHRDRDTSLVDIIATRSRKRNSRRHDGNHSQYARNRRLATP